MSNGPFASLGHLFLDLNHGTTTITVPSVYVGVCSTALFRPPSSGTCPLSKASGRFDGFSLASKERGFLSIPFEWGVRLAPSTHRGWWAMRLLSEDWPQHPGRRCGTFWQRGTPEHQTDTWDGRPNMLPFNFHGWEGFPHFGKVHMTPDM